ncbi:fumarylacetoacetate hydrolase family protein [Streptomyces sp. NPDC005921]|uniref:fumarylacetoacetate hydrolase family protein n=1 Tax=Streptomyces sp. NPDC005827 TaxID=3157070 RepID=UPI0034013B0D
MRLATVRLDARTAAVRIDGESVVEVGAADVGALLRNPGWRRLAADADGPRHRIHDLDYAPLVPRPPKIICVGLNYRAHILEAELPIPRYPTLFAKFAPALVGALDDIELSGAAAQWDWEAELGLVIGAPAHRVDETRAASAIAGYTVLNDVSARDWQTRTEEWLQGKTFVRTTPVGPHLVTRDEAGDTHDISCEVNGELMQKAHTGDLVFGPAALVAYISTILPLEAGDLIATGTPGGVGLAQNPSRFLADGDEIVTRIAGVGECRNTCRRP